MGFLNITVCLQLSIFAACKFLYVAALAAESFKKASLEKAQRFGLWRTISANTKL